MYAEFDESLVTGNKEIDSQHKEWIDKINDLVNCCENGGGKIEAYLLVRNVEGLENGAYHYLPMEHALEFLHSVEDMEEKINSSMCDQRWCSKANVIFYWAVVAYRVEWRYGIYAHRPALIDVGHVGQNLYLACSGLGLGCCAIASFDDQICKTG